MTSMTWIRAVSTALAEEMERDDSVFVMGNDVRAATF